MLVVADPVGGHVIHDLAAEQVGLERPAGARCAARRHHNDVLGVDQARGQQRREGERGRGRKTPRCSNPGAGADGSPSAGQFRHPVRPNTRVFAAVGPAPDVGVGEPMVGAQVDHPHAGRQRRRERAGRAVRKREEHDVGVDPGKGGGIGEDPAGQIRQVRMNRCDVLPGRRTRRHQTELDLRMAEQQPQQFAARVATRPCHRRCHPHD